MKKISFLLCAVLVALYLSSCDRNGSPADTATENPDTQTVPTDPDPTVTSAATEEDDSCFDVPSDMDELRAGVIDYFNKMANVKWKCAQTIDFTGEKSFTTNLLYTKNTTYYGLPYTSSRQPGACLEEFLDYLDGTGTYIGPVEYRTIVGGDCGSPRRAWAWGGALCDVGMTGDDFVFAEDPAHSRKNPHFVIPVEGYDYSHYDHDLPYQECIMGYNNIATMCEAYAKLKACDVIGKRWYIQGKIEQHIRMIVEDATVVRNGTGAIVPSKSYVVYSEQTSTPEKIDGRNTTWKLGVRVSFQTLYTDYYIPLTNACLAKNTVTAPTMTISGVNKAENMGTANIFKGVVKSNYNIFYTNLDVTDANGNTVIHSRTYPYALSFNVSEIPTDRKPNELPAGTYHYTLTATIGFGTKTLIDMTFTK